MFSILFFDFFIFGGIFLSFLAAGYFLHHHSCKTNTWYPCWALAVLALIPGLVLIYGSFIESQLLVVTHVEYTFPEEKSLVVPKRIVLISDTHIGPYKKREFSERVVKKIRELKPDAILMTGDYFLADTAANYAHDFEPYSELPLIAPTFAVLGNHEFKVGLPDRDVPDFEEADLVRNMLADGRIIGLEDAVATLFEDDPIYLVGAQDLWSSVDDFDSIALPDRNARTIVMSHNPDIIFEVKDRADLVVSGHTHGGQIRLPFIGALGSPGDTLLPREFFQGASTWGDTTLYVTSGLGESGPRARLFNPPEIVLMTLR